MPCHALPCPAMPCHALPCHAMPCHAVPCHAMPCHALPCPAMPCPAMPCHAMPCHALPCPAMPCHAMPCHALPCHALPCPAMPCHAMPCPALPCSGLFGLARVHHLSTVQQGSLPSTAWDGADTPSAAQPGMGREGQTPPAIGSLRASGGGLPPARLTCPAPCAASRKGRSEQVGHAVCAVHDAARLPAAHRSPAAAMVLFFCKVGSRARRRRRRSNGWVQTLLVCTCAGVEKRSYWHYHNATTMPPH